MEEFFHKDKNKIQFYNYRATTSLLQSRVAIPFHMQRKPVTQLPAEPNRNGMVALVTTMLNGAQ